MAQVVEATQFQFMGDIQLSHPIIIAGMHRSGTSLLARLLAELGVHIGSELDTHHESVLFKTINREFVQSAGASWYKPDRFLSQLDSNEFVEDMVHLATRLMEQHMARYGEVEAGQHWGWKDPRNTITLPIWLNIFPQAKVVFIVRNGIDVALSLQRREFRRIPYVLVRKADEQGMKPPTLLKGYRLWQQYLTTARKWESQHTNWFSLRYEDLIEEPAEQIKLLCEFLDLELSLSEIRWLAERTVRQPTTRSVFERLRVKLMLNFNLIDTQTLIDLGYQAI